MEKNVICENCGCDLKSKYMIRIDYTGNDEDENKGHILLFNERIKFNGNTPNFPSMLAILQ